MKNFYKVSAIALAWATSAACCAPALASAATAEQPNVPTTTTPTTSAAADTTSSNKVQEIVVTAQKREERIQSVGMSIQAASGDTLTNVGVNSTGDLVKIIPGFSGGDTGFSGAPVYSIRGVGFLDPSLAGNPTVSVYNDQIPMPFSIESLGSTLDLQRVEVLKGPQGTLFGENATGGAINYIANKPTDHFDAGGDLQYGRFNTLDVQGFVSGPLTDTLDARFALRTVQSDGYQKSYTSDATLGARDFTTGRLSLLWRPISRLKVSATLSGFYDGSQSTAPQFEGIQQLSFDSPLPAGLLAFPIAPHNDQAADFGPCVNNSPLLTHCVGYKRRNTNIIASLRADYDIGHDMTLTALTSYERFKQYQPLDQDGTTYRDYESINTGHLETSYGELRLSGLFFGRGAWLVGGNFEHDGTNQGSYSTFSDSSAGSIFGLPIVGSNITIADRTNTFAGFGHAEYPILDNVTIEGGLRLTQSNQSFTGCERDNGNGYDALLTQILQNVFTTGGVTGPGINPGPGGCVTLSGPPNFTPGLVRDNLNEGNVSYRFGANWRVANHVLLYANVSQGFKAGAFSGLAASEAYQYDPAKQERLIAYETGFKSTLLDQTLQLNGATFYYDYSNKQIQGNVEDVFFGALPKLINIPQSHVVGFELSAVWKPIDGLTISPTVSYAHSRIDGNFSTINYLGQVQNMTGEKFPGTPETQADIDAQYEWPVGQDLRAFVGTNINYQGSDNSLLGDLPIVNVPAYTLVDLRAGFIRDSWRLEFWGRNVFDKYYYGAEVHVNDVYARFAGMPATYGVTLSYRFH